MVYTVIPYRLPQRPRWGLPRAVGIDSSGIRGQRPSQPEESGGFCLSISRTGNFVTTAPDELILSKQDPSLGLSWTNTSPGNTDPDSESLGVFSSSEKAGKPGRRQRTRWGAGSPEVTSAACVGLGEGSRWPSPFQTVSSRNRSSPAPEDSPGSGKLGVFSRMTSGAGRGGVLGLLGVLQAWKARMDWPAWVWGSACRHALPGCSSGRHVP